VISCSSLEEEYQEQGYIVQYFQPFCDYVSGLRPSYYAVDDYCEISGCLAFRCSSEIESVKFLLPIPLDGYILYIMCVSTHYWTDHVYVLCKRDDLSFRGAYSVNKDISAEFSPDIARFLLSGKIKEFL